MTKFFLNLTNGLEFLDCLEDSSKTSNVIRLQSTACEQKRWDFILSDLDHNFLFNLAIGNICVIVDYSAHKAVPRAIYQGLEWIKFVLNKIWYNEKYIPFVRGCNCTKYFEEMYKTISLSTFKKLKYYRKFLSNEPIKIDFIANNTIHDSDNAYYLTQIRKYL